MHRKLLINHTIVKVSSYIGNGWSYLWYHKMYFWVSKFGLSYVDLYSSSLFGYWWRILLISHLNFIPQVLEHLLLNYHINQVFLKTDFCLVGHCFYFIWDISSEWSVNFTVSFLSLSFFLLMLFEIRYSTKIKLQLFTKYLTVQWLSG